MVDGIGAVSIERYHFRSRSGYHARGGLQVDHFASPAVPCMRYDVLQVALFQRCAPTAPPRNEKKKV